MTDFVDKKWELCDDYDLFFSDLRVYKMLPKCLGREFYWTKKYPYPVKFKKDENLQDTINELFNNTYFIQGNGPNYALRIGRTDMKSKEVVENVIKSLP